MPKRTKDYHSWLIKRLAEPHEAQRYLQVAKADSPEMFLKALRNVAEAKKMARVAEEAGVNRESLYRALSEAGNPAFYTVESVLNALGMTLTVQLKQSAASQPPTQGSRQTISQTASLEAGGNAPVTTTTSSGFRNVATTNNLILTDPQSAWTYAGAFLTGAGAFLTGFIAQTTGAAGQPRINAFGD